MKRLKRPKISPEESGLADAVRRATPPGSDPSGVHTEEICALSKRLGLDHVELLDAWSEHAALREYDGELSRAEAERLAVEDVRERFDPQRKHIGA